MAGNPLDFAQLWRENAVRVWATAAVILVVVFWKLLALFISKRRAQSSLTSSLLANDSNLELNSNSTSGLSKIIYDVDLLELMKDLDPKNQESENYEVVVDKKNDLVSYTAKCCKPKDAPLKYLSVTIFEKCDAELLRDFYMDNEYRKEWDRTLIEYKQLEVDESSGTEIGCMIKKFPLLTPREYVLAWRVWEGDNKTFYCVTMDCEHSLAPRQRKYVRVGFFKSGWRIRKVPGRDACEVTMVHQEDAGMNVEMAKLAFANGIWNYVCKMNDALRSYSPQIRTRSTSVATMLRLIKKVPRDIQIYTETESQIQPDTPTSSTATLSSSTISERKPWNENPSKKMLIAHCLLLLCGIACLSKVLAAIDTPVARILKKLARGKSLPGSEEVEPSRVTRTKQDCKCHG